MSQTESGSLTWTDEDRATATRSEVYLFSTGVDREDIKKNPDLPTDIHIVEYQIDETLYCDAVRSPKKINIFDVYYDRLKGVGTIISISSGYGTVNPKMWGYKIKEDSK